MKKENACIEIKGVRVNNLKNVDLKIPRNTLTVITGLSGSGKSSLAYDTIYAEGQRRYVESLSAYARQFLGRMHKPEVDFINGIPPAIAIEQKVTVRNAHSTVGTSTEIYEYLKLLFARVGETFSPVSGERVCKDTVTDVVNFLLGLDEGSMVLIAHPVPASRMNASLWQTLQQEMVSRVVWNGSIEKVSALAERAVGIKDGDECLAVVDRVRVASDEASTARFADSVQIAFEQGDGACVLLLPDGTRKRFSNLFERDGMVFDEPSEYMFSFNSSFGACPACEGFGTVIGIDERLVVPDKSLSIYENAVACWRGETMGAWKDKLLQVAGRFDFPVHKPYEELSEKNLNDLWHGNRWFGGIDGFFAFVDERRYKIQYRVMKARFSGRTVCPECHGGRLRKEASYVKVGGRSIQELSDMPVAELLAWFAQLTLTPDQMAVAERLMLEIRSRLAFLCNVGLGYLTLSRRSATLSGGESQRINLAKSLGSSLLGSLYILDEPSVGLHPQDIARLQFSLRNLRDHGNTVLIVEHHREIIAMADHLVDMGPLAGRQGGEVMYQGDYAGLLASDTLTGRMLRHRTSIKSAVRRPTGWFHVTHACLHNLKDVAVDIPQGVLTVIAGVAGSGKSSLMEHFMSCCGRPTVFIGQKDIGINLRSTPATYLGISDTVRRLFARESRQSIQLFSFNSRGGCPVCKGKGVIVSDMAFMESIETVCEECRGSRYSHEVLQYRYRGKNIAEVMDLTVDEAIRFFEGQPFQPQLQALARVGLGYLHLNQSMTTLSGGELQRVKLADQLHRSGEVFVIDEPTDGLHLDDVRRLLQLFNEMTDAGNTLILIEHSIDVMKQADYLIELGPGGGAAGGRLLFAGTPAEMLQAEHSVTRPYLEA